MEDIYKGHCIYKILNIYTERFYIGQAKDVHSRKGSHVRLLRRGRHYNKHLQHSWNKWGEEAFLFSVLEEGLTADEVNDREIFLIDQYKNEGYDLYNIEDGGNPQGVSKRVSDMNRRLWKTPEYRERMVERAKNFRHTEEFKARVSRLNANRVWKDSSRQRLRESRTGRKASMETRRKMSVTRRSKGQKYSAFGENKSVVEWTEDARCCVSETGLRKRFASGIWSTEEAITAPPLIERKREIQK